MDKITHAKACVAVEALRFGHHLRGTSMSDVYAAGLDSLDAMCDDTLVTTAGFGDRIKAIRDVMKGLVASGAVNAKSVWAWLPVILQLIQTLGPKISEIIEAIKKAIGGGLSPESFVMPS